MNVLKKKSYSDNGNIIEIVGLLKTRCTIFKTYKKTLPLSTLTPNDDPIAVLSCLLGEKGIFVLFPLYDTRSRLSE